MNALGTRLIAAVAALVLVAALLTSLRFAYADVLANRGDLRSVRRAIQLTPLDARAHYLEAVALSSADPAGNFDEAALRAALALNPRHAAAWMALGIRAEMRGDRAEAEQRLLQAAAIDHTFKPAWTLANFYFRAGDTDKFWSWVRTAAGMVEPKNQEALTFDPIPMFDLCWAMTDDAAVILERGIPRTRYVLKHYVSYLVRTGRLDAALPAARLLFANAGKEDYPALSELCENLIASGRGRGAVEVWNVMALRQLTALPPLDPASGRSLTNGAFHSTPTRIGFDWRFPRPGGIYEAHSDAPSFERLEFDGEEPEHCEAMVQFVPVLPGRRYRIDTVYQTEGLRGGPTGLRWAAFSAVANEVWQAAEGERGRAGMEFLTKPGTSVERLALRLDRLPGITRPKGTVRIESVEMRLLP